MDNKNSLSVKIEKLRDEISEKIGGNIHNMSIEELVEKSNELNLLIVEYHKLSNKEPD